MSKEHHGPVMPPEEHLELLVAESIGGDEDAWKALWLALAPFLEKIARRRRVTSRLSRSVDARRDVVVRVMGGLLENGASGLAELGERLACRDGSYQPWLATVARNSAISHVRAHPEYLGPVEGEGGRWATHRQLSDALPDGRVDPSRVVEARRILAYAREHLRPAQLDALVEWMQTRDFGQIAVDMELAGDAVATRLVRAALWRLRARFAPREKNDTSPKKAPDGSARKSVKG